MLVALIVAYPVKTRWLLASDTGGTKTILALVKAENDQCTIVAKKKYINLNHNSWDSMVQDFLGSSPDPKPEKIDIAVFAAAGYIRENTVYSQNTPWPIRLDQAKVSPGIEKIIYLNDLEAVVYAIPDTKQNQLTGIYTATPQKNSPIGIVSPGTGLGTATGIITDSGGLIPIPGEGGMSVFPPATDEEWELVCFLRRLLNKEVITREEILSGRGLSALYRFYSKEKTQTRDPEYIGSPIARAEDPVASKTIDKFLEILGKTASDYALINFCHGGIFLGGGITPKIWHNNGAEPFLKGYFSNPQGNDIVKMIPVWLLNENESSLAGAIEYGKRKIL